MLNFCVPYIEKESFELDYVRAISKKNNIAQNTAPIDIESIIRNDGINIFPEDISQNGNIHGMLSCSSQEIELWDKQSQTIKKKFFAGDTILVENSLLKQSMINRYRFTLAHEYAHWVLHKKIIEKLAYERRKLPFLGCFEREIKNVFIGKCEASCEWQANFLGGAILMPYLPLKNYSKENSFSLKSEFELYHEISILASKYMVSKKAMYCRLRQWEYVRPIKAFEKQKEFFDRAT